MKYKFTKPDDLEFIDDSLWLKVARVVMLPLGSSFSSISRFTKIKNKGWHKHASLRLYGEALYFSETALEHLSIHENRLKRANVILYLLGFLFTYGIANYFIAIIPNLFLLIQKLFFNPLVPSFLAYLTSFLSGYVAALLALRLIAVVTRFFARTLRESVAVYSFVNFLVYVSRDDVLTHPDKKRMLVQRMERLERLANTMGQSFVRVSESNREWIDNHFHQISLYISERQRWVVCPTEKTLTQIRDDFYALALMFISGDYGKFSWDANSIIHQSRMTWKERIAKSLPRIISFVVPALVMGYYLIRPDLFPYIHIARETVTLILFSWLLIFIDSSFGLGIVSNLTSFVKEIKSIA